VEISAVEGEDASRFDHPADLDPRDWSALRADAHRMLDDILDYVERIRDRPSWRRMPDDLRHAIDEPLPRQGQPLAVVHSEFMTRVLPFATGNVHPGFMGWVHGGGTVFGALGEMLAAGLNANLGGRDHAPVEVEKQVIRWAAELFGLPETSGGLLVTGTSIANFIAVVAARVDAAGPAVRATGAAGRGLVAYTSTAAHACIPRAMDMAGLGTDALRLVPVDGLHRIDVAALGDAVARDRKAGLAPFMVTGTAGTVDVGATDDLLALAALCRKEKMWFHVDGAFGALGMLSPTLRPLLAGIESADSIAFDFHKWGQVPYDAGCILVRDRAALLRAFSTEASYLRADSRGLAAGAPWPCDMGPDLSRGFRALKVWFTIKALGADRLGASIDRTCAVARHLAARVDRERELERVAPVALNIVCFRFRFDEESDRKNAEIVADVQERGVGVPSTTRIDGRVAVRCAIVNHRTRPADVDALVDAILAAGRERAGAARAP
jgi:aromatic-L-amino-acid decarboxylase